MSHPSAIRRQVANHCLLLACWLLPWCLLAGPASSGEPAAAEQVETLLDQLDDDRYDVRETAFRRLQALADEPSAAGMAERAHARLLTQAVSFEVRARLTRLLERLPPVAPPVTGPVEEAELAGLIDQLAADSFAARLNAAERLERLLERAELITPILLRVKERLATADAGDRALLTRVWRHARGAWLMSDPRDWRLPDVSDERIAAWIDELCRAEERAQADSEHGQAALAHATPAAHAEEHDVTQLKSAARQELVDLLAREDCLPRVVQAIEQRLADEALPDDVLSDNARARLTEVLDWTRPALVAEYWQDGRNLGVQYLYVDVPTTPDQGLRPSHFDRINDRTAHCVTGNSLATGDYPVGVLFPHPRSGNAQFCIVNLPTPLRRLQFEHVTNTDDRHRWPKLCERTLARFLAEKRSLDEAELQMLYFLDARALSRFAGAYLAAVDDRPYGENGRFYGDVGNISRHGVLMLVLTHQGTHEAIDGLGRAIAGGRVKAANHDAPYDLPWLASLAIAARDPWREVDAWLAERVPSDDALIVDRESGPQRGATAAGLLLRRHGIEPGRFGLHEASDEILEEAGVAGYRYTASDQPQAVLDAWRKQAGAAESP